MLRPDSSGLSMTVVHGSLACSASPLWGARRATGRATRTRTSAATSCSPSPKQEIRDNIETVAQLQAACHSDPDSSGEESGRSVGKTFEPAEARRSCGAGSFDSPDTSGSLRMTAMGLVPAVTVLQSRQMRSTNGRPVATAAAPRPLSQGKRESAGSVSPTAEGKTKKRAGEPGPSFHR